MDTNGYTPEEPIAAVATAIAPAALGIIRTSGKGCIELVAALFSRPEALRNAAGNTLVYGWIVDPAGGGVRRIDEVLISVFRAPKSFTGEDMAEICCHGGPAIVTGIYRLLTENGFRAAQRGEFTFRAFINGKADLTRAEAVHEIISAKTDESRGRAAGRLAGSLYDEISAVKKELVATLASVEAEIEYPEDEETIADAFDDTRLRRVETELASLCSSWASEKLYQDGARVVLCGRTNAGKSSLFNMLLKEERAIVSDIHGTTRDWLESWASFGGIPARLFDTAGLRETDDVVEQSGVRRTFDLTKDADLILYVVDAVEGITDEDESFLTEFAAAPNVRTPLILILNKCDKLSESGDSAAMHAATMNTDAATRHTAAFNSAGSTAAEDFTSNAALGSFSPAAAVRLSAKTGSGTAALTKAIKACLTAAASTDREQPGLGSARQKQCAQDALDSVRHALLAARQNYPLDAVAQDMEDALDALGEITGAVTPDDILDTVFSNFCLGK